jgi:hypothetical protein
MLGDSSINWLPFPAFVRQFESPAWAGLGFHFRVSADRSNAPHVELNESSMDEKDNRKVLKNQYKQQQLEDFRQSLPMSVVLFRQLFDFLDENLDEETGTDLSFTQQFCIDKGIDFDVLRSWLIENGGGDDSEVLWNIEERFEKL